jgi:hypothetical protein
MSIPSTGTTFRTPAPVVATGSVCSGTFDFRQTPRIMKKNGGSREIIIRIIRITRV